MTGTLTVAGIKFCAALLGVSAPTYDDCWPAVLRASIYCDRWNRCPTTVGSMPDSRKHEGDHKGYECIEWARYDIYDGSKGSNYFCWRPAKYIFDLNTATFRWELQ